MPSCSRVDSIFHRDSAAAYIAKVRIAVRAGAITITREGCGSGNAKALDVDFRRAGPIGGTARKRDSAEYVEAAAIGVGAWLVDLTKHVNRPKIGALDRHPRIENIRPFQLSDDRPFELGLGQTRSPDGSRQRQGDKSIAVDFVLAGQTFLAVDNDSDLIARSIAEIRRLNRTPGLRPNHGIGDSA
jgi:hypothetical protein